MTAASVQPQHMLVAERTVLSHTIEKKSMMPSDGSRAHT